MQPTNTADPDYYHKGRGLPVGVSRAHGRARVHPADRARALLRRLPGESRVERFPGILGRVCDRPCEPACRRGRVEEKPVAICRLKRVAADLRDDITPRLPKAPAKKNGKRSRLHRRGPAHRSTVANDLLPIGYEVVIFEQYGTAGGLMRTNIPAFRLPARGARRGDRLCRRHGRRPPARHARPEHAANCWIASGFDAVFVGTGAPKGKELSLPGREATPTESTSASPGSSRSAFGHIDKIGERVLIIGVGNTAMDCCRTSPAARRERA